MSTATNPALTYALGGSASSWVQRAQDAGVQTEDIVEAILDLLVDDSLPQVHRMDYITHLTAPRAQLVQDLTMLTRRDLLALTTACIMNDPMLLLGNFQMRTDGVFGFARQLEPLLGTEEMRRIMLEAGRRHGQRGRRIEEALQTLPTHGQKISLAFYLHGGNSLTELVETSLALEHFTLYSKYAREHWKTEKDPITTYRTELYPMLLASTSSVAGRIASRLRSRIASQGWQVGTVGGKSKYGPCIRRRLRNDVQLKYFCHPSAPYRPPVGATVLYRQSDAVAFDTNKYYTEFLELHRELV